MAPKEEFGQNSAPSSLSCSPEVAAFSDNNPLTDWNYQCRQQIAMQGFSYPPFAHASSIRLLSLEPRDDRVTLNLFLASLEDKPYYEAISYTWGDVTEKKEITCGNQLVTVPENLYDALRHLRCPDRVRTLWVDAICINQVDIAEKSAQIRIMADIYENAQAVLVWIGKEDDETERIFSEARRLAAAQRASNTEAASQKISYNPDDHQSPFSDIAKGFLSIFRRDWFKRIWVIQEVSVCRKVNVVCGPLIIDWEDLMAVLFATAVPGTIVDGWRKATYAIFEQRKDFDKSNRPPLSLLIVRHQDSLATKAEDKIYALLGLASDVSREQVTISYDTMINDIYQKVALSCLIHDQDLSILGSVQSSSSSTLRGLPSWVSDWSVPRMAYALTFHDEFSSTPAIYTAAKETKYAWKQPQSRSGLILSGFRFDRIIDIGYADETNIRVTAISHRQNLKPKSIRLFWLLSCERITGVRFRKQKYITGEDILDVYWQTLCAGCTLENFDIIRKEFLSFDAVMKILSFLHTLHLSSSFRVLEFMMFCFMFQKFVFPYFGIKPPMQYHGFDQRIVFGMGRRMARTSEGYIGLVPARTQPGDCVWLLKGGNVPFVVRDESGTKRLVGEAYIHGIMKGEAFDEGQCEDIEIV